MSIANLEQVLVVLVNVAMVRNCECDRAQTCTIELLYQGFAFTWAPTRLIRTRLASARAFRSYMLDEVALTLTDPLGTASGVDRMIDYKVLVVD